MRRMIEPDLAYLAAERATEEEIGMLEKVLVPGDRSPGGITERTWTGISITSWRGRRKTRPPAHHRQHVDLLADSREQYLQVEGRPQKSILRHREVLDAIRAREPERAKKCMLEHLMDIEISLFGVSGRPKIEAGNRHHSRRKEVNRNSPGSSYHFVS